MRKQLLAIFLGLLCFARFSGAVPLTHLPVGDYTLTGETDTPGHLGTVTGRLFFEDSSRLTYAYIEFTDLTLDKVLTFTVPGPSFIMTTPEIAGAEVFNSDDHDQVFDLFVQYPSDPSGIFSLSHCGLLIPCGTNMQINADVPPFTNIHVEGEITPIPEPSSFMLLGTGALAIFYSRRLWIKELRC
jgi:hypothetical protein